MAPLARSPGTRRVSAPRALSRRECLRSVLPLFLWPRHSWAAPRKPNILFVMIDTLRADHVGCYGYGKPTTPHLDRLAEEGVRFANVWTASPWTMPSLMTMFTSLHPSVHGATSPQRRASLKVRTLAERLKDIGYRRTAGIVANPMVNSRYGFGQGFDLYDDYTIFFAHELNLFDLDGADRRKSIIDAVTSETVSQMAIEWLGKEGSHDPWFLFLLYFDPHNNYVPPPPWDRKFDPHPDAESRRHPPDFHSLPAKGAAEESREHLMALYDGEIGHTDDQIGRLLTHLDGLGLRGNTLVAVVSDHGEEFLDHGGTLHGRTLYNELTHGMLILRHPGTLPTGKVTHAPICHLDLTPTLLACMGEKPDPECQGVSRLQEILGAEPRRASAEGSPFFLEAATKASLRAVVVGRHKLILDTESAKEELYDLDTDPREKTDIAGEQPGISAGLRGILREHVARCAKAAGRYEATGEALRPQLTRKDIDALRALGYLQ